MPVGDTVCSTVYTMPRVWGCARMLWRTIALQHTVEYVSARRPCISVMFLHSSASYSSRYQWPPSFTVRRMLATPCGNLASPNPTRRPYLQPHRINSHIHTLPIGCYWLTVLPVVNILLLFLAIYNLRKIWKIKFVAQSLRKFFFTKSVWIIVMQCLNILWFVTFVIFEFYFENSKFKKKLSWESSGALSWNTSFILDPYM